MIFTYPAVVTPHEEDDGFHVLVPDLEGCEADGGDLEDALEYARDAATDWVQIELDEFSGMLPASSHPDDLTIKEGQFIRMIMVNYKLMPDND